MTRQYINVQDKWGIVVYHCADETDEREIRNALRGFHCKEDYIEDALKVLGKPDTGFTYTDNRARMSLVVISDASSKMEYLNTIAHETMHIVSAICEVYHISEFSEEAAYLTGNIVMDMTKWVY